MGVQLLSYALGLSNPAHIYKCFGVLTSAMEAVELLYKTLEIFVNGYFKWTSVSTQMNLRCVVYSIV